MKLIKNISKKDFARNTIITFLLMTVATIISFVLFYTPNFSPAVIAPIYIHSWINTYRNLNYGIFTGNYCSNNKCYMY